jgi:hypothetical protein
MPQTEQPAANGVTVAPQVGQALADRATPAI